MGSLILTDAHGRLSRPATTDPWQRSALLANCYTRNYIDIIHFFTKQAYTLSLKKKVTFGQKTILDITWYAMWHWTLTKIVIKSFLTSIFGFFSRSKANWNLTNPSGSLPTKNICIFAFSSKTECSSQSCCTIDCEVSFFILACDSVLLILIILCTKKCKP